MSDVLSEAEVWTVASPVRSLFPRLLAEGIPSTLLIDLLDPAGMKHALAGELLVRDVELAPAPPLEIDLVDRAVRSA